MNDQIQTAVDTPISQLPVVDAPPLSEDMEINAFVSATALDEAEGITFVQIEDEVEEIQ